MSKTLSFVVPLQNEEGTVAALVDVIRVHFGVNGELADFDYQIILVNDGSTDRTQEFIDRIASSDDNVHYVEFSRGFGRGIAITAGLQHASGDAVIVINGDLSHPPEYIPKFVAKWQKGFEVVHGLRAEDPEASAFELYFAKLRQWTLEFLSDEKVAHDATDFMLLDRIVVDAFRTMKEQGRSVRRMVEWIGFAQTHQYFESQVREERENDSQAIEVEDFLSTLSYSLRPVRVCMYIGLSAMVGASFLGLLLFIEKYGLHGVWGWDVGLSGALATLVVFLVGLLMCVLSILGFKLVRIHNESLRRPLYVVRSKA